MSESREYRSSPWIKGVCDKGEIIDKSSMKNSSVYETLLECAARSKIAQR